MKRCIALLIALCLLPCLSVWADGAAGVDPFAPVTAAQMTVTDAEINEDGTAAVRTGSMLTAEQVDFGEGAAVFRILGGAPAEGRLVVKIYLDTPPQGMAFMTAVFSPATTEYRLNRSVEGTHDIRIVFEGEGTFASWQAFATQEDLEAALRAEHSAPFDNAIPNRYLVRCPEEGTVEALDYTAHDYSNDGAEYEKRAFVYLPYGYDPEQTYDLLILCHGIGGNENEWGLNSATSRVRAMMDNLIYTGEIRPFIVVTPNGRGGRTQDASAFYDFDRELRYDLLPAIAARYSVDITDRNRCAMAGLSMGGMQTISLGIGRCLDLFSAFGAFSAAGGTPGEVAARLNANPDLPVRMFYVICGTEDSAGLVAAAAAMEAMPRLTDQLGEDNFVLQLIPGGHDFGVWYLGFYNFARMIGGQWDAE